MRELNVNIEALVDAMELGSFELSRYYVDTETGEVVEFFCMDEDDNELDVEENDPYILDDRYIFFEPFTSCESYRFMERFVDMVTDQHLQDLLNVALNGCGAFKRFKDVLFEYPDERERWFVFQHESMKEHVIDWLKRERIKLPECSTP